MQLRVHTYINLTNIYTMAMGWVTRSVCPDLSPPEPLDQSKNVTLRIYKLWEDKNGQKNWPKSAKKKQKFGFPRRHVAEPGEA